MTEERKSIWRRPWKGWRGLIGWFVILFASFFFTLFALGLLTGKPRTPTGEILLASLIIALIVAFAITLLIGLVHWICCWRNFRKLLFGLACFATLVALFYAEENIRGKWAWNSYAKKQAAKGEVLDLLQLAPPPIPDDENFAAAPVFATTLKWFDKDWRRSRTNPIPFQPDQLPLAPHRQSFKQSMMNLDTWMMGKRTDLGEWQTYYQCQQTNPPAEWETPVDFPVPPTPGKPAADVLMALSLYDPGIEQLKEATARPASRFPVHYEDGVSAVLPHLNQLRMCNETLTLRAVAEIAEGNGDAALADIDLSFRLIESVQTEPINITQLVRMRMFATTLQPIWEGLANQCWNDEQLAAIEVKLGQLDFLDDYQLAMRGERAFGVWYVDFLENNRRSAINEMPGMPESDWQRSLLFGIQNPFAPSGWFDQNKVVLCETIDDQFLPLVSTQQHLVDPETAESSAAVVERYQSHPTIRNCAARLLLPALARLAGKFAFAQAMVDLARVAIALERYRLANGDFPESLDSLAPRFIDAVPHDVINGQPLHYRRTSDDRYLLYSVGWNQTDDGGEVALSSSGNTINRDEGDWVWELPDPKLQPY